MGEALVRQAIEAEESLNGLKVQSAGIAAVQGGPPSRNSVAAMANLDIDISDHRGKLLSQSLLDRSFLTLCMTSGHEATIRMQFENLPPHLTLMRGLMDEQFRIDIPDPVGLSLHAYEMCRDAMADAIPSVIEFLKANYTQE